MLFLKNKNPVGRKRELGGSRFSCIYLAPAIRAQIGAAEGLSAFADDTEQAPKSQ